MTTENQEDATASIVVESADTATPIVVSSHHEHVVASATRTRDPPQPTLPTGEVIDGKNTLQSFAIPDLNFERHRTYQLVDMDVSLVDLEYTAESTNIAGNHPTLPTGEVIDGKNTLQNFENHDPPLVANGGPDVEAGHTRPDRTPVDPPKVLKEMQSNEDDPPNRLEATPPSVLAVAVATDLVYAELAPASTNGAPPPPPPPVPALPWYHGRWIIIALLVTIAVLLVIGLGLGIYFGLDRLTVVPMGKGTALTQRSFVAKERATSVARRNGSSDNTIHHDSVVVSRKRFIILVVAVLQRNRNRTE